MGVVPLSITKAKSRSNVESDLFFDGTGNEVNALNLGASFDFGTNDFSFDFFFENSKLSGSSNILSLEDSTASSSIRLVHTDSGLGMFAFFSTTLTGTDSAGVAIGSVKGNKTHCSVSKTTNVIKVKINTIEIISLTLTNSGDSRDFSGGKFVIGEINGTNPMEGVLSQIVFYNKALSNQENLYRYQNGGFIPESSKANCIAHYALTERYAFKADAAFILNHPQFIVGDNVFFDLVESYNHAKITPLTANHAKAVNFTDDELGVINPSTQTVKKDFYNKETGNFFGLKCNGTDQYAQQDPLTTNIVTTNRDNITLYAFFTEINDTGVTQIPILFRNGSAISFVFQFNVSGDDFELSVELNGSTGKATFDWSEWGKPLKVLGRKLTEDPTGWTLNINGKILTPSSTTGTHGTTDTEFTFDQLTVGGAFSGGGTFDFDGIISEVAMWDRILTIEEERDLIGKDKIPSTGLLERVYLEKTSAATIDTFAGNSLTLNNYTLAEYHTYFLEKSTKLPEIREGLLIQTGISIAKTYTSIVGMGFTIKLLTDIANLSDIITGLPVITKFRINGAEIADETALVAALNINNISHVDLEFASSSPTITFIHSGSDYYLLRDYYLSKNLTQKEAKKLTNNLLLANPTTGLFQKKFNYYALHNEGNYIAGATNPESVPLIDVDVIGNRESLGWTGGDAATKLADLVTNLEAIEQLR